MDGQIITLKFVIQIVLFLLLVVTADARVRFYPFHPMVLTRPKTTTTPAPSTTKVTTTQAATTTTAEPPEQEHEQEEMGTPWTSSSSSFLTHALTTAYFGTTGEAGDNEWEDEMTTQPMWTRPTYRPRFNTPSRRQTTTTPGPTTTETTEEPPENEGQGQSQVQGHIQNSRPEINHGLCFCSPFSSCPDGSIQRGGYCWDMSWWSDHPYIRCCYRPSVARQFYRFIEKRK